MTTTRAPKWAVDVALSRLGIDPDDFNFGTWRDRTYARAVEMVADLIAAHEQPPVDPLHVEAARLVFNAGFPRDGAYFDIALVALRRGIELGRTTNTGEAV